jgi:hypothetical protein
LELHHGNRDRAIELFRSIPNDVQVQINQAYFEQTDEAEGWLLIWCTQALLAIRELTIA